MHFGSNCRVKPALPVRQLGLALVCLLAVSPMVACAMADRISGSRPAARPSATRTPAPTFTAPPTQTPTVTFAPLPSPSPSATATETALPPTATATLTGVPPAQPAPTDTPVPTIAPTATDTPASTVTATPQPVIQYVLASTAREFDCDHTTIYGAVRNANGQGIPGVTVRALGIHETTGLDFSTLTDSEGRYEIFRIPLAELMTAQWAVMVTVDGVEASERFHWASTPVCQSDDLGHSQVLRVDWVLIQ